MTTQQREDGRRISFLALGGDVTEDAKLVRLAVDHEIPLVTEFLDVLAQNPDTQRVKRTQGGATVEGRGSRVGFISGSPFRAPRSRDQLVDALLHFARGLVREGHAQDVSRRDALFDQVGNAICDDARLAGARAGEDQNRSLDRLNGESLLRVQRIQVQHARAECKAQGRERNEFARRPFWWGASDTATAAPASGPAPLGGSRNQKRRVGDRRSATRCSRWWQCQNAPDLGC